MYSTCLFCNASLGTNAVVEPFPIGRRLAFDAAKGRLWVVCRKCERWNLTPLEERWEAIEVCERMFGETRIRVSTDNIGLARLPEGLELVRVGSALRPEFAAWRYGDQFGRRRRRRRVRIGVSVAVLGAGAAGAVFAGVTAGVGLSTGSWWMARAFALAYRRMAYGDPRAVVVRVPLEGGAVLPVRRKDLDDVRLSVAPDSLGVGADPQGALVMSVPGPHGVGPVQFAGAEARRVAGMVLPAINAAGADERQVSDAVRLIENASGDADVFLRRSAYDYRGGKVAQLPTPARLALEMAVHEEAERRAMQGELALLDTAWRDAEEIANIADDLLLPPTVDEFLGRHGRK